MGDFKCECPGCREYTIPSDIWRLTMLGVITTRCPECGDLVGYPAAVTNTTFFLPVDSKQEVVDFLLTPPDREPSGAGS